VEGRGKQWINGLQRAECEGSGQAQWPMPQPLKSVVGGESSKGREKKGANKGKQRANKGSTKGQTKGRKKGNTNA